MKKTMKTLLALMAGVMTFSACSNEDVLINETPNVKPEVEGIRTFTAFTESDGTRATIDGMSVKWQENDEILVMSDNDHFDYYRLTDGANTTSGTFEAEYGGVSGNPIYAVYPMAVSKEQEVTLEEAVNAAVGCGVSETIARAVLNGSPSTKQQNTWNNSGAGEDPIVQAYLNGDKKYTSGYPVDGSTIKELYLVYNQTVDPGEMVCSSGVKMVAKADDANNLAFKNVCSYIKVTTTTPLNRIEVRANNGEYLSGKFDVDFSSEVPVPSAAYDLGTTSVMFGAVGDLAPGTYYIAVLPGTLAGGLTIEYYTDENNHIDKSTSSSFTFERNKVYNAGSQP